MGVPVVLGPMGVISSVGNGLEETLTALKGAERKLRPAALFSKGSLAGVPTGEVASILPNDQLPRTHQLARLAADQIFKTYDSPPDAVVVGTTTGGISRTEELLLQGETDPKAYGLHGANTVATDLARRYGCMGPTLTVAAACASGAMAIALAAAMIRKGLAERVLAGGVDGLCRLTCFGFKSLQLIDPVGARPLDQDRRGMSVAEGAGFVMLCRELPEKGGIVLLGSGLSCDAYHAVAPHPEGLGALAAMQTALKDADLTPDQVTYINLHGTATPDNDRSEARAVNALFGPALPFHSSVKGAMGHTLAAAGAIETVVSALCLKEGIVPANVGLKDCDPDLKLSPVLRPRLCGLDTVLSNSFGFGGGNAALVFGHSRRRAPSAQESVARVSFAVLDYDCITGAGFLRETVDALSQGRTVAGSLENGRLCRDLEPAWIRRAKRLTRLALALAVKVHCAGNEDLQPRRMVLGTGWGALSETHDFLTRLFDSNYQFPSPTDFIGSVHNAPAGQVAQLLGIKGANVTTSGGNYSFEQALLGADLLGTDNGAASLVMGVDEAHAVLSPRFDLSFDGPADGGGALLLSRDKNKGVGVGIELLFYGRVDGIDTIDAVITQLLDRLGNAGEINRTFGALLVGIPLGEKVPADKQLECFLSGSAFAGPKIDYRKLVGQFAGAAAVAAALCVHWVKAGLISVKRLEDKPFKLDGKGILLLNLGETVTAVGIAP